jgi:hypothetical protein
MRNRTYIIAVKSDKENKVQYDWIHQIREFSGVELQEGTSDQVTVLADEEAIRRLAGKLGNDFIIEEEVMRYQ